MARLLISAAHTVENPGAVFQDLREADLTRKLLTFCLPLLDAKKIEYKAVPLDLPLWQRIEWINNTGFSEAQGDIFVELHINDGGKRGVEGWFKGNADVNNRSQKLTETLVNHICKVTGYQNQGSKSEYEHELTSLLVLNATNPTGTCIESLYLDNPEDIAIIKDESKFRKLAESIVDGIEEFLKIDKTNTSNQDNTGVVDNTQGGDINKNVAVQPSSNSPINFSTVNTQPATPSPLPFSTPFPSPTPSSTSQSSGMLMDREKRKEMIKEVYKKIFDKDISQSDLNLYLNQGVSEEELMKKLIESKEFKDLVKDGKDSKELRNSIQKLEGEVALLRSTVSDTKALQDSQNALLQQKNILIQKLYQELQIRGIVSPGQNLKPRDPSAPVNSGSAPVKKRFTRRLFESAMRVTKV